MPSNPPATAPLAERVRSFVIETGRMRDQEACQLAVDVRALESRARRMEAFVKSMRELEAERRYYGDEVNDKIWVELRELDDTQEPSQ